MAEMKKELLRSVDLFQGLGEEAIASLAAKLQELRLAKNSLLFSHGDEGDRLFLVVEGRAKAILNNIDGKETILAFFDAGDSFGEMSLIDGRPRSASVCTTEATFFYALSRRDFLEHLKTNPVSTLRVLDDVCSRLRSATEFIGSLSLLDAKERVSRALVTLGKDRGAEHADGIFLRPRPNQQDLAAMTGTSRETVSRVLSNLQKSQFLATESDGYIIGHDLIERCI